MRQWLCDRWGITAATCFLLLLVLPFLDYYGLWFDEVFSVVMSRSFDSIVQMVRTQENNMLLHYIFLLAWQSLGDGSEFFLRSSSVAFILLSLFPLHAAVRRLSGSTCANIAVLLYVAQFLVLEHARTCRGYSLALLLSALVFWRWVVAWQNSRQRDWLLVGALAGLAVWAHYFSALVPPVLVLAMLWRDGVKQPWRYLFSAFLVFLLFVLPVFMTRPPDGAAQIGWASVPSWLSIRGTLWMLAGVNGMYQQWVVAVVFLSCAITGVLYVWRNAVSMRTAAVGLSVGLIVALLAVLLESFVGQPVFVVRFFAPLVPVYCFVLATALCQVRWWWRVVLVAALLLSSAFETWRMFNLQPMPMRFWWKPVAQQLVWQMRADDVVLVYPSFLHLPLDYYLDDMDVNHHLPRAQEFTSTPYRAGGGVEPVPDWSRLQALTQNAPRVWLVLDDQNKPSDIRLQRTQIPAIQNMLTQQGKFLSYSWHYDKKALQRYDAAPASSASTLTDMQR